MEDEEGNECTERETVGFYSRKGAAGYFILLSILGILVGLFMVSRGLDGTGLSATLALVIGIFVVIKEILDIFH